MHKQRKRATGRLCTGAALAAAVAIAGCGGGGGGTRPDAGLGAAYGAWAENPNAHDIGEHWREHDAVAAALGVTRDPSVARTGLARAHGAAETDGNATGTRLRNIAPAQVQGLGTVDGVSVGQWRDGSGGTFDIDFNWEGAPSATAAQRAATERAGREWARRLRSERSTGVLEAGTYVSIQSVDPDTGGALLDLRTARRIDNDGLLIFVFDAGPGEFSNAGPGHVHCSAGGHCETVYGVMAITDRHRTNRRVLTHEIGHVLDIAALSTSNDPVVRGYVDTENHTFNGPNAIAANGGKPVPLQWRDSMWNVVDADHPGAIPDDSHIGTCHSVMAYCAPRSIEGPTALDFAILEDLGYTVTSESEAAAPETYGYAAWGQWAAWGTGVERQIDHASGADHIGMSADAFGVAPSTDFAESATGLEGSATWRGVLIGVDQASPDAVPVLGRAALEIALADFSGEARLEDLTTVRDGHAAPFRHTSLHYAIGLEGNAFADTAGHIAGALYGPQHEEMAGVVDDDRAGVDLLGAFGGTREERP